MKGLMGWVVALVLVVAAVSYAAHSAGRRAVAEQEVKRLSRTVGTLTRTADSLRAEADKLDTVYKTVYRPRWDSVRITDTVVVDSVVYVPRPAADSAIAGCTRALSACQQAGYGLEAVIQVQDSLIQVLRKQPKHCRLLGIRCETLALVGGFAAGVLVAK